MKEEDSKPFSEQTCHDEQTNLNVRNNNHVYKSKI
jgi:hypothetical protein